MSVAAAVETCNLWGGLFYFSPLLLTWASFPGVRRKGRDVQGGWSLVEGVVGTHILDENVLSVHFWHQFWLARSYEVLVG